MKISKDLVAASATPMLLAVLHEGENYGYAIIKRVRELSAENLQWTDGFLYPLLHRLTDADLIESYWGESDIGRKRRYYRITKSGRARYLELIHQWQAVNTAMTNALATAHPDQETARPDQKANLPNAKVSPAASATATPRHSEGTEHE